MLKPLFWGQNLDFPYGHLPLSFRYVFNDFPFNSFMAELSYRDQFANQWTGFYMIGKSVMKELNKDGRQ